MTRMRPLRSSTWLKKYVMSGKAFAVITGSASGIGLAMSHILAAKGYNLYLVDIHQHALEAVHAEMLSRYPVEVISVCQDLSQPLAAMELFVDVMQRQLEVDILVSNAGFFFFGEVPDADPAKVSAMIGLHVHTPSLMAIFFSRYMKDRKKGHILINSSISAYQDFPGISFYGASKSYLKSFGLSLRHEMKYYDVNVTILCPGATATNLYDLNVIDVEKGKRWGIMMDARDVAQAGIDGMFKKKAVVIPGWMTRIMTYSSAILPRWVIYWARVKWRNVLNPNAGKN